MQYLLYALPALACPIAMGLMMWLMMRGMGNMGNTGGMGGGSRLMGDAQRTDGAHTAPVAELQAELARLEARNRALLDELEARQSADTPVVAREGEAIR